MIGTPVAPCAATVYCSVYCIYCSVCCILFCPHAADPTVVAKDFVVAVCLQHWQHARVCVCLQHCSTGSTGSTGSMCVCVCVCACSTGSNRPLCACSPETFVCVCVCVCVCVRERERERERESTWRTRRTGAAAHQKLATLSSKSPRPIGNTRITTCLCVCVSVCLSVCACVYTRTHTLRRWGLWRGRARQESKG